MEIKALYYGKPKVLIDQYGKEYRSGIAKEKASYIKIGKEKIAGDDVENHQFHGGADRAICIYSAERYSFFEKEYNRPLPSCSFGENITILGMTEENVFIGDIYEIGEVIVQVSQGRFPCITIEKRTGFPQLLKRIVETGYTGYFFRVLKEGTIEKGDPIKLIDRTKNSLSVMAMHQLYFHEKNQVTLVKKALENEALAKEWRDKLQKRLKSK